MTDAEGVSALAAFGAHLGLFEELSRRGPGTSAELAARMGLDRSSVSDWLIRMTVAGYLTHDPATARFSLPSPPGVRADTGPEGAGRGP